MLKSNRRLIPLAVRGSDHLTAVNRQSVYGINLLRLLVCLERGESP